MKVRVVLQHATNAIKGGSFENMHSLTRVNSCSSTFGASLNEMDIEKKINEILSSMRNDSEDLKQKLNEHRSHRADLEALKMSFKNLNCFDSDDLKAIDFEIEKHQKDEKEVDLEIQKQSANRKAHEELLGSLKTVVASRQECLENQDSKTKVLENHPDLLKFFAEKQIKFTKITQRYK